MSDPVADPVVVTNTDPAFSADGHFQMSIAHYFIMGASIFSIFWGIVNVCLVSHSIPPNFNLVPF